MSEFVVCRTLSGYCLLLDDYRIAGGKPDYRGNNYVTGWRTEKTYGETGELMEENEKLRKVADKYVRQAYALACEKGNPITKDIIMEDARELGVEVDA